MYSIILLTTLPNPLTFYYQHKTRNDLLYAEFFSLYFVFIHPKLLTMCYKFIDKKDIFTKKNRKEGKTEHWSILVSRMNSVLLSLSALLRYDRNSYIEPLY